MLYLLNHQVLYTVATLGDLLRAAGFDVDPLEYFDGDGTFHSKPWDVSDGMISRSILFDDRNRDGKPNYTSLIVDAIKPI
jgi:predicted SAM-dependent methyltransferase